MRDYYLHPSKARSSRRFASFQTDTWTRTLLRRTLASGLHGREKTWPELLQRTRMRAVVTTAPTMVAVNSRPPKKPVAGTSSSTAPTTSTAPVRWRNHWPQLVVIARAIVRDGRVLVLDEPTSSLPGRDCEKLLDVICRLREQGMAVIYISHRLNEIYSLADRITVLHEGRVMGTLEGEDISTQGVIGLMSHGKAPRARATAQARDRSFAQPLMTAMLQARELTDGLRIKPSTFDIASGEVVGLTGLVGSGRSRLCRLLCGADPKSGGSLRIDGRDCDFRGPAQALRAGVVYVPEAQGADGLFPRMSLQDNVTLGLVAQHRKLGLICDDAELARRCREVMERLHFQLPADGPWAIELSGGMRQKLALARGLVMQPKLLILDEPLKGLDADAIDDVDAVIRELAAQGSAILWVAADASEIVRVCDRALIMCEGEITGSVDPAQGQEFSEGLLLSYATGIRHDAIQAPF
jgi:ribose transport system ATP-binding protein